MAATTDAYARPERGWLQAVVRFREVGIILFILVLAVLVSLRTPAFLTPTNFNNILLNIAILVIVALGQTMVIITRGIDVGTKAAVHGLMSNLAAQGMVILMISSELPEVLGMSDRILVMREGRLTGQFSRAEATQETIMAAATAA